MNLQNHTILKNKLLYHAKFDNKPITADIFLTNFCNNNCKYCTYKRWNDLDQNKQTKYMLFEEFKKYTNRLLELGVKGLVLTGGGEPTLNPDFDKITSWLEKNNIDYGINTNFNIFKKFKPKFIKISFDGYDEISYKEIRGTDSYNTVIKNINEFNAYRTLEKFDVDICLQMVVSNWKNIIEFCENNKNLPVDSIVIRPIESRLGEFFKNENKNSDENIKTIIKTIKEYQKREPRLIMNYKWNVLDYNPKQCYANWSNIAIDMYGNVLYCCHKPNEIVGNIMDADILEKKLNYKTDMNTCDVPCRLTGSNQLIEQMQEINSLNNFV